MPPRAEKVTFPRQKCFGIQNNFIDIPVSLGALNANTVFRFSCLSMTYMSVPDQHESLREFSHSKSKTRTFFRQNFITLSMVSTQISLFAAMNSTRMFSWNRRSCCLSRLCRSLSYRSRVSCAVMLCRAAHFALSIARELHSTVPRESPNTSKRRSTHFPGPMWYVERLRERSPSMKAYDLLLKYEKYNQLDDLLRIWIYFWVETIVWWETLDT